MKITITGSLGNVSKPLAIQLVKTGHQVTVISSDKHKSGAIEAIGGLAAIGSIADVDFLVKSFTGSDIVYTMVPPNFSTDNLKDHITGTGKNYVVALQQAGVKKVVNLSSMGAHLDRGPVAIAAAREVEEMLDRLADVSVIHLRAPFFYTNYYGFTGMIRNMGILGSNYGADTNLLMVHPKDLARAATDAIALGFSGKSIRYVVSDERSAGMTATILGTAIGRPDLQWIEFSDEQALEGILQSGVPMEIARSFVETGTFLRSSLLWEDYYYQSNLNALSGTIKLEAFAEEFAAKYNNV